ncbi:hypothetical protein Tco_0138324 [Tanacetum coccineum]
MESIKKLIDERALHKREYDTRVNERQMQTIEGKVDTSTSLDANIRPIYDEELMAETTELLNQSLESENICLKKIVAQFHKDFSRMEAHCIALELKYQNQAVKSGQHGQVLKAKSNQAKVKHDINVIETINIELELKVAKLLKENETLKKHYKELSDSIKITRAKTIEHTTSLIAQNAKWVPTGKIFTFSTTKVDTESLHGSNTDVTNLHKCIQNLVSSVGTSINVQEEQTLDLNADTPFNLKKERIKVRIKENVIYGRPRLHGIALIQEISARQMF